LTPYHTIPKRPTLPVNVNAEAILNAYLDAVLGPKKSKVIA
jgi:hypothetical protein